MPLSNLPRVMHEADAAVLVVDLATSRVEYANLKAVAMAGNHALPVGVDEWGRLAGLVDPEGEDLAGTDGPLSRVARGEPVAGELIRREPGRASDAAGDEQERQSAEAGGVVDDVVGPLWVTGFPLGADLGGRALVVFMRLTASSRPDLGPAAQEAADAAGRAAEEARVQAAALRDRAVIATDLSFTISDPSKPDNPLVWVNPAFTRTTGYGVDDVLGLNCRFLQGPDTDRAAVNRIREALRAGEPIVETLLNYRKDGTAFWNQVSISPVLDAEGRLVNFVGVQADVTERVLVQEQRERALAAEKRARAGLVLLDRVSDAVIELDAAASMTRLARVLTETIAPWAAVVQLDRSVEVVAASGPGLPELVGVQRRVGPPRDEDPEEDPLRAVLDGGADEAVVDLSRPYGTGTVTGWFAATVAGRAEGLYVALPLVGRGNVIAVLLVGLGGGADDELEAALTADEDQRKLIRVAARRTGLALENARLYAREHALAETLQRSMLPERSSIPGLDVWAHYMPNVDHAQVGGDWFDVLPIADDIAGVVVGDVVGHDVEAAATMGQLRSVVRSYAYELEDPGSVLMRVDHLASGMGIARMASVVLMSLHRRDDGEWDLSWSSAGHLPPLLCRPTGTAGDGAAGYTVRALSDAVGTLIGLVDGPRQSGATRLHPGDVVVAYTDGLIERRSRPMPDGLRLLEDVLRRTTARDAAAVGERLLAELGDSPEDDTAVVVLRVPVDVTELPSPRSAAPRQRRWQLPSDPSSVGKARHATLRACAVWGVPRAQVAEVVVSELVANAVLHGWGVVQLRLFETGTGLRVEVEDGNPEPPRLVPARPLGEGGHGLHVVGEVARWGWSPTRTGKLVWAHLATEAAHHDATGARTGFSSTTHTTSQTGPEASP
ncbi:SpoIIE family protein phosphatase [Aquipuribacter nitratireducens]|uniref:SpoIIE family protein phosphatase n=1 Tax=Aquipuribacter nitratireducens TaxID=650104 RepID=A0ABW0GNC1_9MICO